MAADTTTDGYSYMSEDIYDKLYILGYDTSFIRNKWTRT